MRRTRNPDTCQVQRFPLYFYLQFESSDPSKSFNKFHPQTKFLTNWSHCVLIFFFSKFVTTFWIIKFWGNSPIDLILIFIRRHHFECFIFSEYQVNQFLALDGTKPFSHAPDSQLITIGVKYLWPNQMAITKIPNSSGESKEKEINHTTHIIIFLKYGRTCQRNRGISIYTCSYRHVFAVLIE